MDNRTAPIFKAMIMPLVKQGYMEIDLTQLWMLVGTLVNKYECTRLQIFLSAPEVFTFHFGWDDEKGLQQKLSLKYAYSDLVHDNLVRTMFSLDDTLKRMRRGENGGQDGRV